MELKMNLAPISDTMAERSAQNCNIYTKFQVRRNENSSFLGLGRFEGIPQNLVLNIVGWIVLHLLFIILRKKAWNYGRIAVMQKEEIKWTDMFYGGHHEAELDLLDSTRVPMIVASASSRQGSIMADTTTIAIIADSRPRPSEVDQVPILPKVDDINDGIGVRVDDQGVVTVLGPEAIGDVDNRKNSFEKGANENVQDDHDRGSLSLQVAAVSEIKDKGYFSWIKIVYSLTYKAAILDLTDQQYRDKCGPDCVFYLSFQRHLIVLASIITFCSLVIILPINLHSSHERWKHLNKPAEFSDTTIINLDANHNFLWAHIILSIVYLFVSIAIMRNYSKRLQFTDEDESDISRSVILIGLKKSNCREDLLRAHFAESYRGTEISEISFAYDTRLLQDIEFKRLSAVSAKIYFQELLQKQRRHELTPSESRPKMRPYLCGVFGHFCKRCDRCKETDAIEYYAAEEKMYTEQMEMERQKSIQRPLGIAFVTFTCVEHAERIVEDYACSARIFLRTPESQVSQQLNSNGWIVKYAPPPEDINWENLTLDFKKWYIKFVLVNVVLMILVIIFSTPVYLFTILAGIPAKKLQDSDGLRADDTGPTGQTGQTGHDDTNVPLLTPLISLLVDTLPTIIVWIIGITLIWIVYRSDLIIGFWTKTAGNLSEMIKTFLFLSFMVLILPSLGVTSASYIIEEKKLVWSCIFYKENGALFVNYICTSSLVGTAAELMRLPELFMYAIKLSFARSKAEVGSIRKSVLWEFQIGTAYAWTMLHFAIFTCFCLIYPLVTPFGLIYLCLKHWTDRYNIYFAYAPCKVDKDVHGTAVNFVIMCMFMLQINLLAYVHFHLDGEGNMNGGVKKQMNSEVRALQVFSLLGFSVTAALFLGQLCFNVCADFSPIHHYKSVTQEVEGQTLVTQAQHRQHRHHRRQEGEASEELTTVPYEIKKEKSTTNLRESLSTRGKPVGEVGGVTKLPAIPVSSQTSSQASNDGRSSRHPRSDSLGSGYSSCKPYGRYIPPLLRPEFVRMVRASGQQIQPHKGHDRDTISQ